MKKVSSYLKKIDIFGSVINFTFDGEGQYTTVSGALLSIILFVIVSIFAE